MARTSLLRVPSARGPMAMIPTMTSLRCQSSIPPNVDVPEEDYYNGHLLTDHLEYLDDVLEKTIHLEEAMADLQDIRQRKKQAVDRLKERSSDEVEGLFRQADHQSETVRKHIVSIKETVQAAKQRMSPFAVDAPDGTPDGYVKEESTEIQKLINKSAASQRNKNA
jgi:hypothetical protein